MKFSPGLFSSSYTSSRVRSIRASVQIGPVPHLSPFTVEALGRIWLGPDFPIMFHLAAFLFRLRFFFSPSFFAARIISSLRPENPCPVGQRLLLGPTSYYFGWPTFGQIIDVTIENDRVYHSLRISPSSGAWLICSPGLSTRRFPGQLSLCCSWIPLSKCSS